MNVFSMFLNLSGTCSLHFSFICNNFKHSPTSSIKIKMECHVDFASCANHTVREFMLNSVVTANRIILTKDILVNTPRRLFSRYNYSWCSAYTWPKQFTQLFWTSGTNVRAWKMITIKSEETISCKSNSSRRLMSRLGTK